MQSCWNIDIIKHVHFVRMLREKNLSLVKNAMILMAYINKSCTYQSLMNAQENPSTPLKPHRNSLRKSKAEAMRRPLNSPHPRHIYHHQDVPEQAQHVCKPTQPKGFAADFSESHNQDNLGGFCDQRRRVRRWSCSQHRQTSIKSHRLWTSRQWTHFSQVLQHTVLTLQRSIV